MARCQCILSSPHLSEPSHKTASESSHETVGEAHAGTPAAEGAPEDLEKELLRLEDRAASSLCGTVTWKSNSPVGCQTVLLSFPESPHHTLAIVTSCARGMQERAEGRFDESGHYIENSNKDDVTDAWLASSEGRP